MAQLKNIYDSYPTKMVSEVRQHRTNIIKSSKKEYTGSYYWIPRPDSRWELDIYPDQEFSDNRHSFIWQKYVLPHLAVIWGIEPSTLRRNLANYYASLPRGRVLDVGERFIIYHGNDTPVKYWKDKVVNAFNLRSADKSGLVHIYCDQNQKVIEGSPERLERILGKTIKLNISSPSANTTEKSFSDLDNNENQ